MSERGKKFLSYYKPYMGLFLTDMICAFIVAAITLINPLIVRYITNDLLVHYSIDQAMGVLIKLGVAMIGLAVIQYVCNYFVTYKGHMMGANIEYDMRNDIFAHYQKLSFEFFDDQKTGQLMSRITNDLFDISELLHHGPEDLLISIIKFVGAFVILLNVNVWLTMIVFAFIPLMFIFAAIIRKKMKRAFKRNRETIAEVNARIEDNLSGIRVVKSFTNEQVEMDKFREGNQLFLSSKDNSYHCMADYHSGLNFFISMLNVVVIIGGGTFIAKGLINLGDLITFLLYINNLIEPIQKLINFTEQYQNGISGFERFMDIMEIEPKIKDKEGALPLSNVRGKVTFENVAFQYSDTTQEVFKNISLSVDAGKYVAVVGSSGVGKSTLCNLIPRFYDVTDGVIKIDDQDIRNVTLDTLRSSIGMVQQDVYLFAGTVKDNIRYGRLDATDEEIIEAAKNANAHEFILGLPEGYDTYIGQRGVKLSGGQKQRLSIARVFLKNPPILIFDEATSALDNESEKIVQKSLEHLAKNRTTFVIAHRLTTIRNAESIVVLSEDGIREQGSHEELMKLNGEYAHLYNYNYAG
ncbi:lipid A export ATP-binding/permease protein MsbA [Lachnospiraceae bacterium KM106-2]|nr:lipid A export ATP-binding/permease protein MsbA [Lachnospiraceae bacterium KM106-2]